jgi:hypothetical protein
MTILPHAWETTEVVAIVREAFSSTRTPGHTPAFPIPTPYRPNPTSTRSNA